MILRLGELKVELISNDGEVVYKRTISENEIKNLHYWKGNAERVGNSIGRLESAEAKLVAGTLRSLKRLKQREILWKIA